MTGRLPAPAANRRTSRAAGVALVVAALIPLLWPGDVPFINDEPQLIGNALAATAAGRLAPVGLQGTFGAVYGPLPTWTYQALTAITHDLVSLAALHALLMSLATAAALWWLARSLGLWPWFAPVALLSPYFWFYARALWDNTYQLPLGGLAVAGYAAFLATQSSVGLRIAVAAMMAIPLVHLMGLALVAPLAAHMALFHHRMLWRHRFSLAGIASAMLVAAWPYWTYLARPRPAPAAPPTIDGWLFPLLGGRLLGAGELGYFYGPEPVSGPLFAIAGPVSSLTHLLVWCGIGVAIWRLVQAARARDWPPRAHVAMIAVAVLAAQSIIHGVTAKFDHPHYHNGAWITIVLLAWFAVDALVRRPQPLARLGVAVTSLIAAANLAAVAALALGLHRTQGTREIYGPTLANQLQVAKGIARFARTSPIHNQVIAWERFPHTLALLRQLTESRRIDLPRRTLDLRYASDDPRSGAITLVEQPAAAP